MSHKKNATMINALTECAAACWHCAASCLEEEDVKMLTQCIKLDADCAQICMLTASFAARNSAHTQHIAEECAEICDACASECEKHASKMDHCRELCRSLS